jgi:hypothetical protein
MLVPSSGETRGNADERRAYPPESAQSARRMAELASHRPSPPAGCSIHPLSHGV